MAKNDIKELVRFKDNEIIPPGPREDNMGQLYYLVAIQNKDGSFGTEKVHVDQKEQRNEQLNI